MSDLTPEQEADEPAVDVAAAFAAGEKHTTRPPAVTPALLLAATAENMRQVAEAATLGTAYHWIQDGSHVTRPDGKLWGDMRGTPVAEHVAAFDPRMALALAGFLDAMAAEYVRWPPTYSHGSGATTRPCSPSATPGGPAGPSRIRPRDPRRAVHPDRPRYADPRRRHRRHAVAT